MTSVRSKKRVITKKRVNITKKRVNITKKRVNIRSKKRVRKLKSNEERELEKKENMRKIFEILYDIGQRENLDKVHTIKTKNKIYKDIKKLIKNGIDDINKKFSIDNGPNKIFCVLSMACALNYKDLAILFMENGSDINKSMPLIECVRKRVYYLQDSQLIHKHNKGVNKTGKELIKKYIHLIDVNMYINGCSGFSERYHRSYFFLKDKPNAYSPTKLKKYLEYAARIAHKYNIEYNKKIGSIHNLPEDISNIISGYL